MLIKTDVDNYKYNHRTEVISCSAHHVVGDVAVYSVVTFALSAPNNGHLSVCHIVQLS